MKNEWKSNPDIRRRDTLIFGKYWPGYDVKRFEGISVDTLETLIQEGFADPEEAQNCAPSTQEFLEFMRQYPGYKAHGYVISEKRHDCRVSIEGVVKGRSCASDKELMAFVAMFRYADEFEIGPDGMYCWFD